MPGLQASATPFPSAAPTQAAIEPAKHASLDVVYRFVEVAHDWVVSLCLAVNLASQGTLWTPDQSVKLDRGSPVTPVQHPDNALDDRPVCLQHHENLVLRTLNNGGNILLRDAPSTSWTGTT